ncbi:MAG: terminase, partial [Ruminococcus sp.]|nr:terminase [Ruminococcus sp.]
DVKAIVVDGANGQKLLEDSLKDAGLMKPHLPTVKEIITANAAFEQGICNQAIEHMSQPSMVQAVSNCEKRAIGSNGGFGYRAQKEGIEIAILDSAIYAYWACSQFKEKKKQKASY